MCESQKPHIPHSDPALARGPVLRNTFVVYLLRIIKRDRSCGPACFLLIADLLPIPGHQRPRHCAVIADAGGLIKGAEVAVVGLLRRLFDGLLKLGIVGIGAEHIRPKLVVHAVPQGALRLLVGFCNGIVAVDKGRIVAGIPILRIPGMDTGQKCSKVGVRLLSHCRAVGALMADGKGQGYIRRVRSVFFLY